MKLPLIVLLLWTVSQDPKYSGPQKGEKTGAFTVFDVGARKEVDYVAEWKGAPTLLVFIHELSRPAAQLMRALDDTGQIKQVRGLKTLFVSLSEDRDGAERRLPQVIQSIQLKSPVGVSVDGKEGPGAYGLNREVMMTILVSRGDKVAANFAILSPNETDAPRIRTAVDEVLKAAAPEPPAGTPEELRAELARLREELLVLKEELAALKVQAARTGPAMRRMDAPPPGPERPKEDEKLVNHCRRLIQKQATEEDLAAAVKDIEAYVAASDDLKRQYAGILGRVLDLKYGNEIGQAVMRQQLEKYRK